MKPLPRALSSLLLTFSLVAAAVSQDTSPNIGEQTGTTLRINPDPAPCCDCFETSIDPMPADDDELDATGSPINPVPLNGENGEYFVQVQSKWKAYQGSAPNVVCGDVEIVYSLRPAGSDKAEPATVSSSVILLKDSITPVTRTLKISSEMAQQSSLWLLEVKCSKNTSTACKTYRLSVGGTCSSCSRCSDGSAMPSLRNGTFTIDFTTGTADAGDTKGQMRFRANGFSNPGMAALYPLVPPSYTVTRNAGGQVTAVSKGARSLEVVAQPTTFDPNGFKVIQKANGVAYRESVVQMVEEGGITRLRADSTFAGATYRHEQSQPAAGTLVMESGRVEAGGFAALRRETQIRTNPSADVEVRREIVEERATPADTYQVISDTKSTFTKFLWGWEMTEQVVDPDGAALTSTWTFYQPGETTGPGASTEGIGRLKAHTRHDGYQEFHTYAPNTHVMLSPFAGTANALTTTTTWDAGSKTRTVTESVAGNILSKTSEQFSPTETIRTTFTSAGQTLVTVTTRMPDGADFGGQSSRTVAPDGTLTTYSYSRDAATGAKTVVMEEGAAAGTSVALGTRTTTTTNRFGITIRQISQGIGYGTGTAIFEHMAVTAIDDIGRALTTAYFPSASTVTGDVAAATAPKWTTSQEFACCGVVSETDRTGIVTRHAYDSLRRRVKTNRLGVTTETAYRGLTTETHRYPETVAATLSPTLAGTNATVVSRSVTNLAGTYRESWTPDPTSTTPGALVKSTTITTYQPAAGLSERTVTTTPDNFSQTSESFLDGKQARTFGDLAPAMTYSYTVNLTGLATTRAYLDGTTQREAVTQTADWAGRQVRTDFADGAFATVTYNALGQMVKSTDPDGVTSLMAYNSLGRSTLSAVDLNSNGQIDFGTDTVSFSESFPALNSGNPVMRSLQKVWQPGDTNPAAGTVVSITDSTPDSLASTTTQLGVANPATSLTTLGTGGNMTQTQVSPDGSHTVSTIVAGRPDVTAFYSNTNALIASTAARDASNTPGSGYDTLGRPTHRYDSRTGVTITTYLSTTADVTASTTDPGNRTTSFIYDVRGRQTTVDAPDTLDASGALLANITTTSYFPGGQVQEVNGGQTYRVSHTYDYADRQKTLTTYGATPAVTTWTYSPTRGFLTRKEYADAKGTDYTYTPAGRLATRAWARGITTTYSYDAGGRLALTDYSDTTPDVALSYDALGRKVTESQTNRTQYSFTYNPATLAPASETLAYDLNADGTPDFTRVIERSRDTLQRDTGWQLKDGTSIENQVAYAYDPAGRLGNVTSPAGSFSYAYQANSMGLLSSVTSPAHTVTNTWESTRDVLARKQNAVGAVVISAYDYSVNALGQRTEVAKTGSAFASNRSIAWGYDSLGQVVKADSTAGFNRAYQYDGIGNRKKAADSLTLPATDNYTSNALNQYTTVDAINPAYDDDGNATAYPLPAHLSANSTLNWDAENRLISATVNGTTTTYLYDSGSRRIAQTTGSATTVYVYDAWNPVAEYSGTTLAKVYTWGLDLSGSLEGAGGVGGLLAVTEGTTSHFPTYDGNGNISEYLDSAGATVAHYEYDPFGRTTVASGTKAGDFAHRFSTKPIDVPTGLYYYGYRYLDPLTGRWLSRDPIEESGGANIYGFVENGGMNDQDFLGLYGPAGHFYTTYAVARAVGFSKAEARELAYFSQYPDIQKDWDAIKSRFVKDCDWKEPNKYFHSLIGGYAKPLRRYLLCLLKSNKFNLAEKGVLIHAFADAYAHTLFDEQLYNYWVGHFPDGHDPDYISRHFEKYERYVPVLFKALGGKSLAKSKSIQRLLAAAKGIKPAGFWEFDSTIEKREAKAIMGANDFSPLDFKSEFDGVSFDDIEPEKEGWTPPNREKMLQKIKDGVPGCCMGDNKTTGP